MLDGHVIAGHDDPFHEQTNEALASSKVKVTKPAAECRSEDLQVVAEAIETRTVQLGADEVVWRPSKLRNDAVL